MYIRRYQECYLGVQDTYKYPHEKKGEIHASITLKKGEVRTSIRTYPPTNICTHICKEVPRYE